MALKNPLSSTNSRAPQAGHDLGPLFPSASHWLDQHGESHQRHDYGGGDLPQSWREKTYEFYNVLWIQFKDKIMYRVAAGRVPKDVWEENQGLPERVVLG